MILDKRHDLRECEVALAGETMTLRTRLRDVAAECAIQSVLYKKLQKRPDV